MLDYLDISCLRSTYCLHCCGINSFIHSFILFHRTQVT